MEATFGAGAGIVGAGKDWIGRVGARGGGGSTPGPIGCDTVIGSVGGMFCSERGTGGREGATAAPDWTRGERRRGQGLYTPNWVRS